MTANHRALAADLCRAATSYKRRFADPRGDAVYAKTIATDVIALRAVADLIADGDLKGAYRSASRLDTIVRDSIRPRVWAAMERAVGS